MVVCACLLLAAKVKNESIWVNEIVRVLVETLKAEGSFLEFSADRVAELKRELVSETPNCELLILSLLEFKVNPASASSLDHILSILQAIHWNESFANDALSILNDVLLLQQSRCFKEIHIAALAVLLTFGLGNYSSPKISWWKLFDISWYHLLTIASLIVPDIIIFQKQYRSFVRDDLKLLPAQSELLKHFSVSGILATGSQRTIASNAKKMDHLLLYQSDNVHKRDNRCIFGNALKPSVLEEVVCLSPIRILPVEDDVNDHLSENDHTAFDFGRKQMSKESPLSKLEFPIDKTDPEPFGRSDSHVSFSKVSQLVNSRFSQKSLSRHFAARPNRKPESERQLSK